MRLSRAIGRTLREAPADADTPSHRLLARAGLVDQLAAGLYTILPIGLRVQRKVEAIVRRELDAAGAQEVLMPVLQPLELWQESGRDVAYGPELFRLKDRRGRDFVLAPTHEEAVTRLVASLVRSHRDLPTTLFQIQTKMRDEPRPRAGLLRVREFVMMDAYSFDADEAGMDASFEIMRTAFARLFEACGLQAIAVLADSGAIGGKESVEFVLPAPTGEDTIVRCLACGYAANTERAAFARVTGGGTGAGDSVEGDESGARSAPPPEPLPMEPVSTPGIKTIESLATFLGVDPTQTLKAVFYWASPGGLNDPAANGGELVFVGIRGDIAVNEVKLRNALGCESLRLATDAEVAGAGLVAGSASPVGITGQRTVVDLSVPAARNLVAGGNRPDLHLRNVNYGRDFTADVVADIGTARAGDACVECGRPLTQEKAIELGHIFKLGRRYSEAMGARYLDRAGHQQTLWMGCYGVGIGRTVAAAVEAGHDERGIVWPAPLAPYDVHLVALNVDNVDVMRAADGLYRDLQAAGIDVLYDDRAESAGVKLNDADLLGLPLRVAVGPRGLRQGEIELRPRAAPGTEAGGASGGESRGARGVRGGGESESIPLEGAAARIVARLGRGGTA